MPWEGADVFQGDAVGDPFRSAPTNTSRSVLVPEHLRCDEDECIIDQILPDQSPQEPAPRLDQHGRVASLR